MNTSRTDSDAGRGNEPIALDWTRGAPAIVYQVCTACSHRWYFARNFCPACGNTAVDERIASGAGTVYAITIVARAPTEALKQAAPYGVVLVDCSEGFRVMGHAAPGLQIGDRVQATFRLFGDKLLPYFVRRDEAITASPPESMRPEIRAARSD